MSIAKNRTILSIVMVLHCAISSASLIGRAPSTSGAYQAYYDDIIDATWSLPTAVPASDVDGKLWAGNLVIDGADNWRLPSVTEFTHMYTVNGVRSNQPNVFSPSPNCFGRANLNDCLINDGLFYTNDMLPILDSYGNPTETPLRFSFQTGDTFIFGSGFGAWAITNGDPLKLTVVPLPVSSYLFFTGVLCLLTCFRRNVKL